MRLHTARLSAIATFNCIGDYGGSLLRETKTGILLNEHVAEDGSLPCSRTLAALALRAHCLEAGGRHLSIRVLPGLNQGAQSREHRSAAGVQRELEQVTPGLGPGVDCQQVMIKTKFGQKIALPTDNPSRKKEENAMNSRLLYGTIVLALACGIRSSAAQVQIQLDAAQRAAIITAVRDVKNAPPGHSFNISVGAQVPSSIELYYLPIAALSQAPEVRALKYTMVQNQVVLVDPTNMRIVDVIRLGQ